MRKSITRVMAFAAVCTIVTGAAFGTQALSRNAKETVQAQTTISREQKKRSVPQNGRSARATGRRLPASTRNMPLRLPVNIKEYGKEVATEHKEKASEIASEKKE